MLARLALSTLLIVFFAFALPPVLQGQEECEGYNGWAGISANSNPTVDANTNGNVVQFTVTNVASPTPSCMAVFDLAASATGNVTIVGVSPNPAYVDLPGYFYSVTVDVTYNVGGEGSGTISLERSGYGCDDQCGTANVTILGVHGPVISLVDYHEGLRDISRCVADCFDVVASYATAPYFSNDQARSVHLMYRSSLARPQVFVNIAAWDTTATYPTKMSVRMLSAGGAYATFTNGATEFFFSCPSGGGYYACDSTTNRLGVQFDASGLATGAYTYTLIVRSHRSGGTFVETKRKIRVLVQNEGASPFGAGWIIKGYQRLYTVGNDSVYITDGTGSASFFPIVSYPCSPCSFSPPAGDFSTVKIISVDNGAVWKRTYPDGTNVGFNAAGRMVWIRDARGTQIEFGHNGSNQLVAIKDPVGKHDSLGYVSNRLRWIKDPGGRVDSVTINGSGFLTQIKDPVSGLPFQGAYDGQGRLTQRTDRRGGVWGIAYDYLGKLKADTIAAITTNHGANERPVLRYSSLESGMIPDPATGYGSSGNPAPPGDSRTLRATVTSARGFVTAYALNRFSQAVRIEGPLARNARFTIDTFGRRTIDSIPGGTGHHVVRYTWSGPNLTQKKDSVIGQAGGRTISYQYDTTYNMLTTVSGDVDSLINVLNAAKTRIDSTRQGGSTVWTKYVYGTSPFEYAECARTGPTNLGLTHRVNCRYRIPDGFRNTGSTIDSLSQPGLPHYHTLTKFVPEYPDNFGRVRFTVNAVGDTTGRAYDPLNRVTAAWGPQRDSVRYIYDDSLFVTEIRDPRGQVYTFWPNALGRPDSTEDPAGKRTIFTYDSSGNVVSIVNRRGQTISFTYDSLDQVRFRIVGTDTTKYSTDPLGRFTAVANRESVDTVWMDSLGRPRVAITCRVLVSGNSAKCFRDSSTYKANTDLRDKMVVSAESVWASTTYTATFFWRSQMLLDSMTNFTGQTQTFKYTAERADSSVTFRSMGNLAMTNGHYPYSPWDGGKARLFFSDTALTRQIGTAYSYDTLGRIVRYHHGPSAKPDTARSVVFGAARIVTKVDTAITAWGSGGCDTLGHLGQTCYYSSTTRNVVAGTSASFTYDSVGNRKDSTTQSYAVDPGNRLRRLAHYRMDYDFDGNLVRKRVLKPSDTTKVLWTDSLFWSPTGLLDSLVRRDSLGSQTFRIRWGYDGLGRQVRQSGPGATTTRFIWDRSNLIFKLDSLGSRQAYWTYYPGTGQPQSVGFATAAGDSTLYYVTDALQNTTALLKAHAGSYQIYAQFRYGPFGDSLAATGNGVGLAHFRYKSAYYDGQTGYYRMGARLYDPHVGRFVSEDPLGLKAGVNQYAFAENDPVNGYDPTGTINIGKLLKGIGPIAAFVITFAVAPGAAPEAFLAATKSMAATAVGAAVSAGVESLFTGDPFIDTFYRNFSFSSLGKLVQVGIAVTAGGGVTGVGYNSILQGTVSSKNHMTIMRKGKPWWWQGLTLGSSGGLWGAGAPLAHELGHTLQFIGLSALTPVWKSVLPWGPWIPYSALGIAGPSWWEGAADVMGGAIK